MKPGDRGKLVANALPSSRNAAGLSPYPGQLTESESQSRRMVDQLGNKGIGGDYGEDDGMGMEFD